MQSLGPSQSSLTLFLKLFFLFKLRTCVMVIITYTELRRAIERATNLIEVTMTLIHIPRFVTKE